jgi:N-acetylmuramoyl-L-alanine amidase
VRRLNKIFGSIGHGGHDSGAVEGRFIEKNMNLTYGKACMDELSKYVETKISRLDDSFIGLSGLVAMSNNYNAQIHLAFHLNAGKGDGCEIYHSINSAEGKKLAEFISKEIAALGQNAHGQYVKIRPSTKYENKDYYTELGSTKAIAVILEPAFIDSKDVEFVDTEEELKILGIAVAHGVLNYLGIKVKQEPKVFSVELKVIDEAAAIAEKPIKVFKANDLITAVGQEDEYWIVDINGKKAYVEKNKTIRR